MRITLKQLAVFIAIYRAGSVTLASEQLALSQSAVSTALQELERLLNAKLFERNGKKLVLNESAKKLYPKAVAVLNQVNDIETEFKKDKTRLSIGASSTIGNYLLPPLISSFTRQHPNIEIILHVYNTKEICQGLCAFDYDLGFIEGANHFDELIAEEWFQDELTLFAARQSQFVSADQSLELAQLADLPLVLREEGSGTRESIDQLILAKLPYYKVQQLSHSEAIKQAVCYDFGIGCLSKYVLKDLYQLGKIRYLSVQNAPNLQRALWMISHRNKHISNALQQFMAFCRTEIYQLNV